LSWNDNQSRFTPHGGDLIGAGKATLGEVSDHSIAAWLATGCGFPGSLSPFSFSKVFLCYAQFP